MPSPNRTSGPHHLLSHRPSRPRSGAWTPIAVVLAVVALLAGACSSDDGATVRNLAESEAGSSGSSSGSASASAPSGGSVDPGAVEAEGGYRYASDVTAHRMVSLDVCEIKEALDAEPIHWTAVETIYAEGGNSVNADGSIRTLASFATDSDALHGLDEYHESPNPLDDWVRSAIAGTGIFGQATEGERAQAVEKGVQNQILVAWAIHELNAALAKAADDDLDPDSGAPHNWDEAWAFYHGAAPGCAPHATADSRAANFGTTGDDGATARANEAIVEAMNAGRDALLAGDVEAAQDAADEIVRNLVITYSQAAVRYATLVPDDVAAGDLASAAEHRAEGLAFFRVIEAIVADHGADAVGINTVYDLEAEPGTTGGGGETAAALAPAWSELGIDDGDIGSLVDG